MELSIIQKIAVWAIPLIFAITLHEVAHGFVASLLGDQTAKLNKRLSINPIHHIDVVGTIIVPLLMLSVSNFIFGWAKPVPVDPRNFKNRRRDMALVAIAGPITNLLMAIMWAAIAKLGIVLEMKGNMSIGIPLSLMGAAGIMINIVLAVLNFLPLPPLDGGNILSAILPRRAAYYLHLIEPYSFWILIILIFSGALSYIIAPFIFLLVSLLGSMFGLN